MGRWSVRTILSFFGFALTARCVQCSDLSGPEFLRNDRSLPNLGRRLGANEVPHSTSSTGLRPSARSLADAECYEILAPKVQLVAMMFLIRDRVHPENVWRDWLLPISKIVHPDIECDAQVKNCYKETLLVHPARSVYDEQGFFTFYVHKKPGAPAFPRGSIFYEREVKDPIETEWGSHTLSRATRRLLQAALENPLNQRFVLMCGSSIPLRPVVFTYTQLIAERRSRFDGYGFTRDDDAEKKTLVDPYRYPVSMHEEWPELANHVSGHGQFWVLNRKHAEIVVADEFVDRLFARHCFTSISQREDVESRQWCVSDEQYVGTVLNKALGHALREELLHEDPAMLNIETGMGYKPEAVTTKLILWGRNSYNMSSEALDDVMSTKGKLCHATESPQWRLMILDHWVDKCTEYHIDTREQPPVLSTLAAYPHCPLFLRKFKEQALDLVAPLLHEMRIVSALTRHHHD